MKNIIAVALLLFLFVVPAHSQYGTVKIEGKVVGRDGKPLTNTVISIDRKDVTTHIEIKTDKNGSYFYGGLDKGVYRIAVLENGVAVAAVDNITLRLDDRHIQDFDLRKQNQNAPAANSAPIDKAQKEAENRANTETQGAFNAGLTALNAGNKEEAIKQFSLAAERRPTLPVIFARLGSAYAAAERFSEATDAYKKAAELKPDDASYQYNMGLSACRANRVEDCRSGITKAVSIDPSLGTTAYFNMGSLMAGRGSYTEAEEAFQKSAVHNPNNAETQYQLGLIYTREAATISKAIPYFEKYLKLAPTGPNAATVKQLLDAARASAR